MQLSNTVFTVENSKSNTEKKIDVANMPENALRYVIAYGLKQTGNDSHSQVTFKGKAESQHKQVKADADKAFGERLDNLMKGILPKGGGGGKRISAELEAFCKLVFQGMGDSIEGTLKQLVTKVNKGDLSERQCARMLVVRHKGKKGATKEAVNSCLEGLKTKAAERVAEAKARDEADKASFEAMFADDEPSVDDSAEAAS